VGTVGGSTIVTLVTSATGAVRNQENVAMIGRVLYCARLRIFNHCASRPATRRPANRPQIIDRPRRRRRLVLTREMGRRDVTADREMS
jgi:hypothetical protein